MEFWKRCVFEVSNPEDLERFKCYGATTSGRNLHHAFSSNIEKGDIPSDLVNCRPKYQGSAVKRKEVKLLSSASTVAGNDVDSSYKAAAASDVRQPMGASAWNRDHKLKRVIKLFQS